MSPPAVPPLLSLLLPLLLVLGTAASVEFSVGFSRWPEWEVVGVPGSSVHLPCATNVSADKISWQYNHHFLLVATPPNAPHTPSLAAPFDVREVEGGSELVVNLAQRESQYKHQEGLYQCVAWFGAIALTSLPGRLRAAKLEPYLEEEGGGEVELEVEEGSAARVECGLPVSVPEAQVTFYKDGLELDLHNSSVYSLTPHGDLVMVGVGPWAAGVYSCTAHNPVLGRSVKRASETTVKVLLQGEHTRPQPPQFLTLRSTVYTGTTGSNISLLCLVTGRPKPRIRWTKYGGMLPSSSFQTDEGSLSIVGVAVEDEGTYLCHADNDAGTKEIVLDMSLEVLDPLTLVEGPASQSVEEGSQATLTCSFKGHPDPKVMWVFNGRLVRNDGNILITENGLTIATVEKEHAGIFQCFVHNHKGTIQQLAMVSVVPRTVTVAPNRTLHLPDYSDGGATDSRRWNNGQEVEDGMGRGVASGAERNQGQNGRGGWRGAGRRKGKGGEEAAGASSGGVRKGKKKKGRMVPPSKPRMVKVSDESIMVTWDGPEPGGLPVMFYKIQYKMLQKRSQWMTVDEDIPPHIHSFEVTGLQTGRTYRFRMAAVYTNHDNKLGPTSRRFVLEASRKMQPPASPPTITSLLPQGPTAVTLAWQYDPAPGVPVEGFFINYREATMARDYTKVTVLKPTQRNYEINHLKANVSYDFKIQVFNLAGASEFSPVYKKIVAVPVASTTEGPSENRTELEEDLAIVRSGDHPVVSNLQLYIILGAVLGLLLLIVVVSAAVYSCRHNHTDDDTRSIKYEDTSLHIHRETSTYSLPDDHHSNGRRHNGYLPHQGITVVTPQDSDKVAMESSLIENNNLNVERCYTSPARRIASEDGCELKSAALLRNSHDNFDVSGRDSVTTRT